MLSKIREEPDDMSMNVKPSQIDQYYSNGAIELIRSGKHVYENMLLSDVERRELVQSIADNFAVNKESVDETIASIREVLRLLKPLDMLQFASFMSMMGNLRIGDSELDKMIQSDGELQPNRSTEFIQSLYVATDAIKADEPLIDGSNSGFMSKANEVLAKIDALDEQVQCFLFSWGSRLRDSAEDKKLAEFAFEAQLLYMVRGNRYQSHQREYYEILLEAHSQEFLEAFGLSAADLLTGFDAIERSLSNGRVEAMNNMGKFYNEKVLPFLAEENKEPPVNLIEPMRSYLNQIFSIESYDVAALTGWPSSFVKALSYEEGECPWPEPYENYQFWPITYLPIKRRPFIRVDGHSYCFDYYSFVDNFYRAAYKALCDCNNSMRQRWQQTQKEASEKAVSEIFQQLIPGCTIFANNYYLVEGAKKGEHSENDLIVIYKDTLFIVEVKAGSFVYTPPFVDYEAHIASYKSLLEKPDLQCERVLRYIKSYSCSIDKNLPLLDAKGKVKETIDISGITDIFELSVTVDNINAFAARAERMSFLNLQCGAISIALDDLMVYRDYFSNADDFIAYLKIRRKASRNKRLALNDELDHLGMYAFHDDYSDYADSLTDGCKLSFVGYREPFDNFFEKLGPKPAPDGQLKWFVGQAVVDVYIESNGKPGRNDPCPCRSGKKYKRCHGRRAYE